MEAYTFVPGETALLVSIPHVGQHIPAAIDVQLTPEAQALPDTDWHLDLLYDWVQELGAGCLMATHSRYVVDLNRPPDDQPLYSGATTGLFPLTTFAGEPVYQDGLEPDAAERRQRLDHYYWPYHRRLAAELEAIKRRFGHAVLFDAHSIRSRVPLLFEGRLPDLNLGSNRGASADAGLIRQARAVCEAVNTYRTVLDGRFTGGHITRHYGAPAAGVHALQLELSQRTYMDEAPPFTYREELADQVQPVLRRLLAAMLDWSAARS